ncbi:MAG: hypothetical protein IKZ96_02390 [Bacilli bacterium]|nr:hypothetical protein [Bacilli bacterium]
MKIIITKNTPKDICIYAKDILNGIIKTLNNKDDKESKRKAMACLLALSTFLTSGFVVAAKVTNSNKPEEEIPAPIELELPIDDLDIEQTNPTPFIVERETTYISPTEYVEESRNNIGEPETVDDAIELYSSIFEVKKSIIDPIIYEKIYNNPNFYNDYTLNGVSYPNMHEAIFFQVLDIVYHPGKYGYNNEELRSYIDWETDLSAEEMTFIFSDYFDINPFFAQAIEYTECGTGMNSSDYLDKNNPAGIGPHNTFRNKATGIIYLCYILSENYNITRDSGLEDLQRISSMYCTDGTDTWRNNSKEFYTKLIENGFLYMRRNDDIKYVIDNVTYEQYLNGNKTIRK